MPRQVSIGIDSLMSTMKKANYRNNRYIREAHVSISSMRITGEQPHKRTTPACFTDDLSSSDDINRLRDIRTVRYGGTSSARKINEDLVALTLDTFTLGDERKFSRKTIKAVNINNNTNKNNNNKKGNSNYKRKSINISDRCTINKEMTSIDKLIKDNTTLKSDSFNHRSPLIENRIPREKLVKRREAWTSRNNTDQATVSSATICRNELVNTRDARVQIKQANVQSPMSENTECIPKQIDTAESPANQISTHRRARTVSAQLKSMQRLSCGLSSTPVLQARYGTYRPSHPSYRSKLTRTQSACDEGTNAAPNSALNSMMKRPSTAAAPKYMPSLKYPLGNSTARKSTNLGRSSAEVSLPRLGCPQKPREEISMMIRNGKIVRCHRNDNEEVDELNAQ